MKPDDKCKTCAYLLFSVCVAHLVHQAKCEKHNRYISTGKAMVEK